MNKHIKNGIFTLLITVLMLPLLRQYVFTFRIGKLDGYFSAATDPKFSWQGWWDGSYREKKNEYLNDNMGFRPELLRVNNQVDYSLFKKLHAPWLALGKDNYLFQTFHTDEYYGNDYVGYDTIRVKLLKLKAVQDTLAKMGTSLVVVHAPCKSFFYPEFIGDGFRQEKKTTNIETYLRLGDSLGINQIDMNGWFVTMKGKSKDLLFTKQGIHWSIYGSLLAADSFVKYVEQVRHIRMPHPVWNVVEHTTTPRPPDDDLAKTMNLMFPLTTEVFSYPIVSYPQDGSMKKPQIIYIGDSFLETWYSDGLMEHTNNNWQIWDHFRRIQDKNHPALQLDYTIKNIDWAETMKKADCIVIVNTTISLPVLGHGFIEQSYDHFYPGKPIL